MKKLIKQMPKAKASTGDKKNTRPHTTKQAGYNEEVYNSEEQHTYQKSEAAKDNKKNTSGPKD